MCVCHFQILGARRYRKRQPRQGEESRDIQPADDPTVEPTTKVDFRFNGCPSKNLAYLLKENDQFPQSPQLVGMTKSSDVWNWCTLLAVVRETLKGLEEVKSDERILPKVFYPSESTGSTLFEIWLR